MVSQSLSVFVINKFVAKMLANAKKIRARNERRRAEQGAAEESEDEEYRDADQNLDDLINETDSEDEDDEPRAKKSKSKKFTDQLMETEDGEVVDLSAAHGAISSAQVRSKSKKLTAESKKLHLRSFFQSSENKSRTTATTRSALLLTEELLLERRKTKKKIWTCFLQMTKKAYPKISACLIKR